MATMTIRVLAKILDANSDQVGAEVLGSEEYTGGNFVVQQVSVADSTTDKLLDLGELAAAGVMRIYIESDQDVTLTINSTSDTDNFLPAGQAMVYHFASGSPETNFYVTNASGSAATITIYAIGAA